MEAKPFTVNALCCAAVGFPPTMWMTTEPSQRVERIKQRLLTAPRWLDVERARLSTETYRATEGEPIVIRRAQMLLHLARTMNIAIHTDEIIVGNRSLLPRMGVIAPEGAVEWVDKELDTLASRPQDCFNVAPADIAELRTTIFPYWRGNTVEDVVAARLPEDVRRAVAGKVFLLNQTDHAQGHILPNVENWLRLGLCGLYTQVREARGRPEVQTAAQQCFYDASQLVLQAAAELMLRYAELATLQADESTDDERVTELRQIAAVCSHLAQGPARTFHEALQAVWFLFVLLQIESNASSFAPGRFDQYMLPYLEADLAAGRLTVTEAQTLLEHFWLKFSEIVLLRSSSSARYFAGFPIGFNIVLGGQQADGSDATNLLSYMCLRAQADLGMTQPNLSIRIHAHSPAMFLQAAAFVIGKGSGMPQVFNDEVIIPGQINRGITPADALNYAVVGCVELSTPGKALGWSDASMFNLTRLLELTLFGGKDPQSGEQIGLPTPTLAEMHTYDELAAAYEQQLAHFIPLMVKGCDIVDSIHAELLPSPLLSLVVQDCIARGVDVTAGGAHYNFSGVQGVQIANVADSLMGVQQAVFDEQWLSGQALLDALRSDFSHQEPLRQRLIHRIPKYGNDDERVDRHASHWGNRYCELVACHATRRGGVYQPGFYTVSAHVPMGAHVGATPDGRHAYIPLADGGLSPSAGNDRRGATAMLKSVSKLNLRLASNGTLLNMKFLPAFFAGERALAKFVLLLQGICRLHIPHVQFNVVAADTLRAAQANPDAYRSLVVRVAGYSAYFIELDKTLQDEIIQRTAFGETS